MVIGAIGIQVCGKAIHEVGLHMRSYQGSARVISKELWWNARVGAHALSSLALESLYLQSPIMLCSTRVGSKCGGGMGQSGIIASTGTKGK